MKPEMNRRIALALSGGGIRAMAFHLGVLKRLAVKQQLENIHRISTVSGGSLIVGLIFKECKLSWPSSEQFLSTVYPSLREKLCRRSLQWGAVRQLLNPLNFRFILSRANLLSLTLKKEWNITDKLSELPSFPGWSINGTTAENGKRFRFKRENLGDYLIGYAASGDFPLSDALAVSAAFPGGFGPLRVNMKKFNWFRRPWNAPIGSESPVDPAYKALHLYDGGVYDNLGLEPLFDASKGEPKYPEDIIIASDAGSPLPEGFSFFLLSPLRLMRIADIMSDQTRALRVRTFSNYLQKSPERGSLISIDMKASKPLSSESTAIAAKFPTTLRRLHLEEFDAIANHGYQIAIDVEETTTQITKTI